MTDPLEQLHRELIAERYGPTGRRPAPAGSTRPTTAGRDQADHDIATAHRRRVLNNGLADHPIRSEEAA